MSVVPPLLFLAALLSGCVFGFFYSWSFTVMRGLSATDGVSAIADLTPGVVALLSANPVTAAGTLAIGVGVDIVGQAALFGIEDIRGADTNLPFGGEDLQRQVVTSLRAQAVHQLESTGAIPPGTPPGQYSGALADYFGGTDPYDELNQASFVNAFNYSPDDPW